MNRIQKLLTTFFLILLTATGLAAVPAQQEKRKDVSRALVFIDINNRTSGEANVVAIELGQRLTSGGISVTELSELKENDRLKIRSAAGAASQKDRKILKSFSFTAIISVRISSNTLSSFNGLYVSEARGTLKAVNSETGKTVALANIPTVRGFGNSQPQADRAALENLAKELPQDFIDRVVKNDSN